MNMGKVVARSSSADSLVKEGRYALTLRDVTLDVATAASQRLGLPAWESAHMGQTDTTLVFSGRAHAQQWLAAMSQGGSVEHFTKSSRVDESELIQLYRT